MDRDSVFRLTTYTDAILAGAVSTEELSNTSKSTPNTHQYSQHIPCFSSPLALPKALADGAVGWLSDRYSRKLPQCFGGHRLGGTPLLVVLMVHSTTTNNRPQHSQHSRPTMMTRTMPAKLLLLLILLLLLLLLLIRILIRILIRTIRILSGSGMWSLISL